MQYFHNFPQKYCALYTMWFYFWRMDVAATVHVNVFLDPLSNSADTLPAPAFMQTEHVINTKQWQSIPVRLDFRWQAEESKGHLLLPASMSIQHLLLGRILIYIFRLNKLIICYVPNIVWGALWTLLLLMLTDPCINQDWLGCAMITNTPLAQS